MKKSLVMACASAATALATGSAHAGNNNIYWSVGISAPPVATVISNGPAYHYPPPVVYQAPPPVYYQAPPPVIYRPAPVVVYPAPRVYYAPPPVVYGPRPHWGHHHGHGHWKERGDGRYRGDGRGYRY